VGKGIERILSAYQEALISIEQLRERIPAFRQRELALRAELQAIADQANDRATFLRLVETLTAFLDRLHGAADALSIIERQRILRLVVKDVLIGDDTITIRHSIPVPQGPQQGGSLPPSQTAGPNYLLCKGSDHSTLRSAFVCRQQEAARQNTCLQELRDQPRHLAICDAGTHPLHQLVVIDVVEAALDVSFDDPLIGRPLASAICSLHTRTHAESDVLQGAVTASSGPKPLRHMPEACLEDRLQGILDRTLNHAVTHCRDTEGSERPRLTRLGDQLPS